MLSKLSGVAVLLAEGASSSGSPAPDAGASSMLPSLLPLLAIFVLFYFLLIRPQRREQSRRQAMLSAVKKNDRVITAGGIYGVVTNVHQEADEVTVKVDETTNTKLRMTLSSITRVLGDESSNETANKSS
ncbi:MAG: preprotein translocase subunit YajC [Planctomycetaceae bacterium]|nr:preprotein translocase subunit YajC [Planctomycetaceae bacterium]